MRAARWLRLAKRLDAEQWAKIVLSLVLCAAGMFVLWLVDWRIAVGVFLFAWGNNAGLVRTGAQDTTDKVLRELQKRARSGGGPVF